MNKQLINTLQIQEVVNSNVCTHLSWGNVYQVYGWVSVKEILFKGFKLEVLCNSLPMKRNRCKWKISDDSQCNVCHEDEEITHALITCQMNRSFREYKSQVGQIVFHISIDNTVTLLLKINGEEEEIDDYMNIFISAYL